MTTLCCNFVQLVSNLASELVMLYSSPSGLLCGGPSGCTPPLFKHPANSFQYYLNSMILELIAIYWVFMSALAISMNLKSFKKFQSYSQFKNQNMQWEGLIRNDFNSWRRKNIIVGSFTMFPLKFFALANFLAGAFGFAVVISTLGDTQLRAKVTKIFIWYFNNYGKLMNNLAMKIEDNCKNLQDFKINTPIIISNHSNWFDTFYLTLKYSPVSYVAKDNIKNWPIIGPLTQALNCIYVKRESEKDRNTVRDQIKERIVGFYEGKHNASPLAIFPEGTTSSSNVVLNFKSGAFENLSAITMFCLKYQCDGFLTGEDEVEQSENIFLMLSQSVKLTVTKVEMKPEIDETHQAYRERCRSTMAKTLGFKRVDQGYRDRLSLQKFRKTGIRTD